MKNNNGFDKTNILICDDDKGDIKLLETLLRKDLTRSYTYYEASNKNEIYSQLETVNKNIDFIFLDYHMPDRSGIEWLVEMRELNYAPIIMLTGRGDESTAVEAMKLGASEYLSKDKLDKYNLLKSMINASEIWELANERNALLGIAAHEFRNPLTTIIGYTQLLQNNDDVEAIQKERMLSHISERANHILLMINNLLDETRIGQGTVNLKKQEHNLVEFINEKLQDFDIKSHRKKINIVFKPKVQSVLIEFDYDRLEEVISNLIDNAIKFSNIGSKIYIRLEDHSLYSIIKVIDEGPGIKESELKYLFKLFSNINISTQPTAGEKSTGIGLAICKKIVLLHGGKIEVESIINKGTTFIIKLPKNNK